MILHGTWIPLLGRGGAGGDSNVAALTSHNINYSDIEGCFFVWGERSPAAAVDSQGVAGASTNSYVLHGQAEKWDTRAGTDTRGGDKDSSRYQSLRCHPFQASRNDLVDALRHLAGLRLRDLDDAARRARVVMFLPSRGECPEPSNSFILESPQDSLSAGQHDPAGQNDPGDRDDPAGQDDPGEESRAGQATAGEVASGEVAMGRTAAEKVVFAPWEVSGIALPASSALRFLVILSQSDGMSTGPGDGRPNDGWPGDGGDDAAGDLDKSQVSTGQDIRFWSKVAKLALELMARERFFPTVVSAQSTILKHGADSGDSMAAAGHDDASAPDVSGVRGIPGRSAGKRSKHRRGNSRSNKKDAIAAEDETRFRAAWFPVLNTAGDMERLQSLQESMPAICRAIPLLESSVPEARSLLMNFLDTCVDEMVREWISTEWRKGHEEWRRDHETNARRIGTRETYKDDYFLNRELRRHFLDKPKARKGGTVAGNWLSGLTSDEVLLKGPTREIKEFCRAISDWSQEIRGTGARAAFRTCFRLEPPAEADAEMGETPAKVGGSDSSQPSSQSSSQSSSQLSSRSSSQSSSCISSRSSSQSSSQLSARASSRSSPRSSKAPVELDEGLWHLRFLLQAMDDPSLLIPAERVWQEQKRTLQFMNHRFENPQERLLHDLGRASRLFPKIEESLKTACPESCHLTVHEAYSFLRDVVPVLEESGFGVLVPAWWNSNGNGQARLGIRLRLVSKEKRKTSSRKDTVVASQGTLGLDSIINYDWQVALGGQVMSREEFERLATLKVPLVRIRGEWVELRTEDIEAAIRFWENRGKAGQMRVREALALALAGDDGSHGLPVVGVDAEGRIADLIQQLKDGEKVSELPQPSDLSGQLRPYQIRGYSWLSSMSRWGLGACLADDMGLGKTIQVIAMLLRAKEEGRAQGPALLICPTSLVGNWRHELARFGPSLRVMIHHGGGRLTGSEFMKEAMANDIVLSTYTLAHRDEKDLSKVEWGAIILDEAQNIKNSAAKQSQSIRRLKSDVRVALTGTPIENRLSELWSIMEFLNPGFLGTQKSFRTQFAIPIERYRNQHKMKQLQRLVQPFVLRRLKTYKRIIRDLPEKQEMKVFCTLTREQATLYEAVVRDMMGKIEDSEGMERKGAVLATLLKLKQVCNHPAQFLGDGSPLAGRSGKLSRLIEMLEEVLAAGGRALVFTQFASMGEMLKTYLERVLHREVLFLHGAVPQKVRDKMVTRFQEDPDGPPIFILSLKAGGLGLNLTRANHVFHFDRWWNPAVENQATDRAFRIGQTRDVLVHKFICAGTLEERIDEMIEGKKYLAENVIGAGEEWLTEMSTDELREIFALRGNAVVEED